MAREDNGQQVDLELEGDQEGDTQDDAVAQHRERALQAGEQNVQLRQTLTGLLADPDIAAVIKAKKAGQQIKITAAEQERAEAEAEAEGEEASEGETESTDPNDILLSKIGKLIDTRINKALSPVQDRLDSVGNITDSVTRRDVTDQIAGARKKFPDFDRFKDKMLEVNKQTPGLTVEEVYILAKQRSGKLRQAEQITETERPTHQPRRQAKPGGKPPPRPQGRKGFQDILADTLSTISFDGEDQL